MKSRIYYCPIMLIYFLLILSSSCKKDDKNIITTPILITTEVSDVKLTTANTGGNITSDGGATITFRGVCWSTGQNPTLGNNKTLESTGEQNFTSVLTNLIPNTTYNLRAYATNSVGTGYGNTITFSTQQQTLPALTTSAISEITKSSATCGGNLSSDGGAEITHRGICWSAIQNPTIELTTKTVDGSGVGAYISSITGLKANTIYYVRAYATNSIGTAYGNQINFTTEPATLPIIYTTVASSIKSISAISGGNISSDGGAEVLSRGICWSTNQNPISTDNHTSDGNGTGFYISSLTGLTLGNTYYARAYATNSIGTAYGNEISFTTALALGDSYQGGKIVYFLKSGDSGFITGQTHGLIMAPSDQSSGIQWSNGSFISTGAVETAIGTGKANTDLIVSIQGDGNYAAKLCYDLVLDGYSDWYLPSLDEITKLVEYQIAFGSLVWSNIYWTSSEYSTSFTWIKGIDGYLSKQNKDSNYIRVLAFRSF